jgi:ketosteroid isomerase-like protein
MQETPAIELARRYLAAIAAGAVELADFLHPDMVYEELPNRVVPKGARSDRAAMQAAAARGQKLLRSQRFDVRSAFGDERQALLEVDWEGVLAVAYAGLAPGAALRARCAMIFELHEGKIIAQRNYDCYEPW